MQTRKRMRDVLTFCMAGGKGDRLLPLTQDRAKPAVPFGGIYRIIDFTLSNCINSGIRKIHVLTQYKSISLVRHLWRGWNIFNAELGEFIDIVHPQQRIDDSLYQGTADAVYQNLYSVELENPEFVLILAGDHIYKLDYREMLTFHLERQADVTVGVVHRPAAESAQFGVAELDQNRRFTGFLEKPSNVPEEPEHPGQINASMGIYLFNRKVLEEELTKDAAADSAHDFGKNIIPNCIQQNLRVFGFQFDLPEPGHPPAYWRDVGTLDAYYEANMELLEVNPVFHLTDSAWPARTYQEQHPPAKFVFGESDDPERIGTAQASLVSGGCIISGAKVERSVLSPGVRVHSYSEVKDSILMEGVEIGRHCQIQRAIIDKDVVIPPKTVIGENPELDRKRFTVTDSGITVVAKGSQIQ